jgi:hypothetical protein
VAARSPDPAISVFRPAAWCNRTARRTCNDRGPCKWQIPQPVHDRYVICLTIGMGHGHGLASNVHELPTPARRRYPEGGEDVPNMDARMGYLEGRMEEQSHVLQDLRTAVRHLDDKISRQFTWMVGIQITTLVAVLLALLSRR